MNDNVNHPKHYADIVPGLECIEITRHLNFMRGNAVKYLWRAGHKYDKIEDLKKSLWYLRCEQEYNKKHKVKLLFSRLFRHRFEIEKLSLIVENLEYSKAFIIIEIISYYDIGDILPLIENYIENGAKDE